MPVNIHRVKSLGREPKSIDVVMSCIGKQFSLLSLYPVNSRADKSRLRAMQDFSFFWIFESLVQISAERDTLIVLNRLLRREKQ